MKTKKLNVRGSRQLQQSSRRTTAAWSVLTVTFLTGCGSVVETSTPIGSPEYEAALPKGKYLIRPGDELEVRFFHTPDRDVTLPVRPDGYVSLPYAREVPAAGRTADALAAELKARYSKLLRDPEIAVVVRSFSDNVIHVGGRVFEPGVFPLTSSMTVLQSLFAAGGFEKQGRLSEVLVIRRTPDHSYIVISVDLESVLDGSDPSRNIALMPFDAVVVPNSPIANVNDWVDLYIRQNIPINFGIRPEIAF